MALKLLKKVDDCVMKSVTDFKGNKFKSIHSMCDYYNINYNTYLERIGRGWDMEKALTHNLISCRKECVDHLGNTFESVSSMCKYYKIDTNLYRGRKRKGWTTEKALTTPERFKYVKCKDFNGVKYNSESEMCRTYDIPYKIYRYRISHNWNLKEALTIPVNCCKDYPTLDYLSEQLKEHFNINSSEFQNRKYIEVEFYGNNGRRYMVICDYLGNVFVSLAAMLRYYNVTRNYFYRKLFKYGIKTALTPKTVKDHLGNEFSSKSEMYKHYNIRKQTAEFRLQQGWSLKDALTTSVKSKNYK